MTMNNWISEDLHCKRSTIWLRFVFCQSIVLWRLTYSCSVVQLWVLVPKVQKLDTLYFVCLEVLEKKAAFRDGLYLCLYVVGDDYLYKETTENTLKRRIVCYCLREMIWSPEYIYIISQVYVQNQTEIFEATVICGVYIFGFHVWQEW